MTVLLFFYILVFSRIYSCEHKSELYIDLREVNEYTTKNNFDNEEKSTNTKIVTFYQNNCLNFLNNTFNYSEKNKYYFQNKYYFYKNCLLEYFPVGLQISTQLSLPFVIIKKIFFYNKPFIFQKILEPQSTKKNNVLEKHKPFYKVSPTLITKRLQFGSYTDTSINIPSINWTIYSMFNLKKSYYNDEYVIIEFRHELINSDGKMIMDETQILFHRIYIYKIKELLNSKEPIDFQKSKPFLRIDLPLSMNGFLMKLFNLKNNTIIIKSKRRPA